MIVENIYTSVGVNRTPAALDWGNNGLICYGAANSIALLDPSVRFQIKLFFLLYLIENVPF
jgi:hypothetical protein